MKLLTLIVIHVLQGVVFSENTTLHPGEGSLPPFAVLTENLFGCRRRLHSTAVPSRGGTPSSSHEVPAILENQERVRVHSSVSAADPNLVSIPSSSQESFPTGPPEKQNKRAGRRKHQACQSFPCKLCGKIFEQKSVLNKHLISHSDVRPFSCELCVQKFKRKRDLNDHMKHHSDDRPFSCELCNRTFKRKCDQTRHIKDHSAIYPFSCKFCSKSFPRKDKLKKHMISHSDERPFTCETCGKKFKHKSTLKDHMNYHNDEKPAATCGICNEQFLYEDFLDQIMKIHSNDRSLICDSCNKRFKNRFTLKRHMKIHTNDRTFLCESCDKIFKRMDDSEGHMRIHTDVQMLKCQECRKPFRSRIQLEQHRESHCMNGVGLETFSCGTYFQSFECDDDSIEHSWTHEQNYNMQEPETVFKTTGQLEQENTPGTSIPMNVDRYPLIESTLTESTDHMKELNQPIEMSDDLDPDLQVSVNQIQCNPSLFGSWVRVALEYMGEEY
ncbi:hypothetical protein QAD02_009587 [Eretmocerus hayati]|uniref:Uncharacterized protein n=1 Tax=Eretmocerus hayati TaxID=131215 RepID=A0ACC2NC77_9HYME|nr:hypothetical protein QAD02_009587 [Eretmocerus hayati]